VFANLTGFHLLIVLGVVVLLFGAAKLPLLAKNVGSSARILKQELRGLQDEKVPATAAAAPAASTPQS
jgi:sec-independent protein translocase protein TatA